MKQKTNTKQRTSAKSQDFSITPTLISGIPYQFAFVNLANKTKQKRKLKPIWFLYISNAHVFVKFVEKEIRRQCFVKYIKKAAYLIIINFNYYNLLARYNNFEKKKSEGAGTL